MKRAYEFDLEQAIRSWKAFLSGQDGLDADDLAELETHLRDDVERWIQAGQSPEQAFRRSVRRLGTVTDLAGAYGPVRSDRWFSRAGRRFELSMMWDRLASYVLIARRNLVRSPGYAALNTLGLALGMAVALLTGLFIRQHLTYDANVPDADQIYRVNYHSNIGEGDAPIYTGGPSGRATLIRDEVASVTAVTEFSGWGAGQYQIANRQLKLDGMYTVDQDFFEVFGVQILRGQQEGLFEYAGQMALTESTARELFGTEDPLGKTITRFPDTDFVVAAIVSDPPENVTYQYKGLKSRPPEEYDRPVRWDGGISSTSVFVKSNNPGVTEQALDVVVQREGLAGYEQGTRLRLQPLRDVHLDNSVQLMETSIVIEPRFLLFFGIVGGLLLLVASINYVNLATARATMRAREVGVRKVVGATRGELLRLFLGESVLMAALAFPIGFGLAASIAPRVESIVGYPFNFWSQLDGLTWSGLLLVLALVGILAGFYPALVLSRFRPVAAIGGGQGSSGNIWLRRLMVGTQVGVSLLLICSAVIILGQVQHIINTDPGFNKSQVVVLNGMHSWSDAEVQAFRDLLESSASIEGTALGLAPGVGQRDAWNTRADIAGEETSIEELGVGPNFFQVLQIPIEEGRTFSNDIPSDSAGAIIVPRSLADRLAINGPVLGQRLRFGGEDREIVGISGDIQNVSLHSDAFSATEVFVPSWRMRRSLLIRTFEGRTADALEVLETAWKSVRPDILFEYQFLDESIAKLYISDSRLSRLFTLLASVCVIIACLGLVGLATYSAQRRVKEIGIRKVMGARAWQIVHLLTRDVLVVILVSAAFAIPVVYLAAQKWLENFSERIALSPGLFLLAVGLLTALVVISVAFQTLRAANQNPADSLRHE